MSQAHVEIWRANVEALLAQLAAGSTPETTISTLAEIWHPQVELDATDATAPDLNTVYSRRGRMSTVLAGVVLRVGDPFRSTMS
jgi:hypothetical protein